MRFDHSESVVRFHVRNVFDRLEDVGANIQSLALDICCSREDPFSRYSAGGCTSLDAYYASLLQKLPNLTALQLANIYSPNGDRDYKGDRVFLDELFEPVALPSLTSLTLIRWSVTTDTFAMLPSGFPQLKALTLERITLLRSPGRNAWARVIRSLANAYS